ncbi:MAG: hypothetical protein ACRDG7_00935 [Candidatus Limnocylindria bacterium]
MARDILDVWIRLDRVHCFEEGDGWGSAEPYLWPVFFKIDGETVSLTDSLMLSGTATVVGTYGSHGNLLNTDVDPGEVLPIPEALGSWRTALKPIPVPDSLAGTVDDVAGVAGVIAVLMEEDNVSDSGAVAGYNALVSAIRAGLDEVVGTLGLTNQEVTEQDIDAIKSAAEKAVKDAIKSNQGFFADLWSWLNADDQIGSEVFRFAHDDLAAGGVIEFNKRWKNHGDWQIFGEANASVLCPAEAVGPGQAIVDAVFSSGEMDAMRRLRDERFPGRRGAAEWWALAERNAAAIAWLVQTDESARESLKALGPAVAELASHPEQPMPDEVLRQGDRILAAASKAPIRRLRIDARRASSFLNLVRGRSLAETVDIAAKLPPTRRVSAEALASIQPRTSSRRQK